MPKGMALSKRTKRLVLVVLALPSVLLQAGTQAAPNAGAVTTGAWGGEHIILEVSEKGAEV